jgi:DNA-binding NtrC family response regulator
MSDLGGYPSLDSSIDAIHHHVFDYILKPSDRQTLVRAVAHAAERRRLVIENRELMRRLEIERDRLREEIISAKRVIERRLKESKSLLGNSETIRRVRYLVAQVAPSDLTVLILGETGTGKEVVARMIHESSGRDVNVFLKVNCPAIPETLLESELFGHEPGAFTGAETRKPGRFELAAGGTIFLDEIADLPIKLQAKLLQVIEHKRFTRLGGTETIKADVRIIAATNKPITSLVSKGGFRADLFYRLDEYAIDMPPLRNRREDIPLLANHFCKIYGERYNRPNIKISDKTLSLLVRHHWPGNVRELETFAKRFALDGDENALRESLDINSGSRPQFAEVTEAVRNTEVGAILTALTETKWNRKKAAQLLKISYSSLRRRIAKYDLQNH